MRPFPLCCRHCVRIAELVVFFPVTEHAAGQCIVGDFKIVCGGFHSLSSCQNRLICPFFLTNSSASGTVRGSSGSTISGRVSAGPLFSSKGSCFLPAIIAMQESNAHSTGCSVAISARSSSAPSAVVIPMRSRKSHPFHRYTGVYQREKTSHVRVFACSTTAGMP